MAKKGARIPSYINNSSMRERKLRINKKQPTVVSPAYTITNAIVSIAYTIT
jgi:hypothetical protein